MILQCLENIIYQKHWFEVWACIAYRDLKWKISDLHDFYERDKIPESIK